jgi:superfamily I DNA/RNA helicase
LIIIYFCLELLEKEIDLRIHYSKKFHFILVDEFQDTSTLQMDWLKLMMDKDEQENIVRNCFMAVVSLFSMKKFIENINFVNRVMMIKVFMHFVVLNVLIISMNI